MRKYISCTFILMTSLLWLPNVLNAQSIDIDLFIGVPLPVGDTFLSKYDGDYSSQAAISYPIGHNYSVYIGLQYQRLNYDLTGVDLNIISPKAGLKKYISIGNRIIVIPELSIGYSRFDFKLNSDIEDDISLNGLSLGIGISPKYEISDNWYVGMSLKYIATFMELNKGVLDTAFNKEYHAISPGITITYKL